MSSVGAPDGAGVFNSVSVDHKPIPQSVTARLTGCVLEHCLEEYRSLYKHWYGETLHCFARGSIHDDKHCRYRDGRSVRTSCILRDVSYEDGSRFLFTKNSIYEVLS